MKTYFEWATYPRLVEHNFFHWTRQLYDLESFLKTPIHDSLHWSRRFEYPWILDRLYRDTALPHTRRTYLDAGSGATALQFLINSQMLWSANSIDPDPAAVGWVNRQHTYGNPKATLGGFPNLPFKDNEYDTGICISVLEHLPREQVLPSIKELLRVSKQEILITMDICLDFHPEQMDMARFPELLKALEMDSFIIHPPNLLSFNIDGHSFAVACLHLQKD